jgi:hypothetical protein
VNANWRVTPCSIIDRKKTFEDSGHLQNVIYLYNRTMSHLRKRNFPIDQPEHFSSHKYYCVHSLPVQLPSLPHTELVMLVAFATSFHVHKPGATDTIAYSSGIGQSLTAPC